ncbi:unnamed protein product [Diabrotica balteata]|uniref:DUF4817 domain-containing protein n=1 Tax=Diabrotica balteata TaxID=107213 RepID=A0A9N9TEI5_DIABA|nr:unnamed protein product [Diabrotica balteata]
MADMHLTLCECQRNSAAAARRYAVKYLNRNTPDRRLFLTINRRLRKTGTFQPQVAGNSGHPIMDATDEDILEIIEEVSGTSTRVIAAQLNVPHVRVWRRLKDQLLKLYHLTTVQELLVED